MAEEPGRPSGDPQKNLEKAKVLYDEIEKE